MVKLFDNMVMLVGAGYSRIVGLPLASELLDRSVQFALKRDTRVFEAVTDRWQQWRQATNGSPEQFMSYLYAEDTPHYHHLKHYIGLVILQAQEGAYAVESRGDFTEQMAPEQLQLFWTPKAVQKDTRLRMRKFAGAISRDASFYHRLWHMLTGQANAYISLNYDLTLERAIRRIDYGLDALNVDVRYASPTSGGSSVLLTPDEARGWADTWGSIRNPVLKLHGSLNWRWTEATLFSRARLDVFPDCRPATRGNPFIVPPTREKRASEPLHGIWQLAATRLQTCTDLIVFGTSLPEYDIALARLLAENLSNSSRVFVVNPDPESANRIAALNGLWQIEHLGDHWTALYTLQKLRGLNARSLLEIYAGVGIWQE